MPVLTDEDVGISSSKILTDEDVGISQPKPESNPYLMGGLTPVQDVTPSILPEPKPIEAPIGSVKDFRGIALPLDVESKLRADTLAKEGIATLNLDQFNPTPKLDPGELSRLGMYPQLAKVVAGTQQAVSGLVDFFLTPEGAATGIFGAVPALTKPIAQSFLASMAAEAPGQVKRAYDAVQKGDYETVARELTGLAISGTMIGGALIKGESPIVERAAEVGPATEQAVKQQEGVPNASSQPETSKLHENVPPLTGEGQQTVPVQEGGQGIQPAKETTEVAQEQNTPEQMAARAEEALAQKGSNEKAQGQEIQKENVLNKPKAELSPGEYLAQSGEVEPMAALREHYEEIRKAVKEHKPVNAEAASKYEPDVPGSTQTVGEFLQEHTNYTLSEDGKAYVYKPSKWTKEAREAHEKATLPQNPKEPAVSEQAPPQAEAPKAIGEVQSPGPGEAGPVTPVTEPVTEQTQSQSPQAQAVIGTSPESQRIGITPAPAMHAVLAAPTGRLLPELQAKLRGMSGESLPRITMGDRLAGEAGVRYGSSQIFGPYAAEDLSHRVLPDDSGIDPSTFGAALTEQQLRGRRASFQAQANAASTPAEAAKFQEMANNVKTLVGRAPFRTEADLLAFVNRPEVREAVNRLDALYAQEIDPLAASAGLDVQNKPQVGALFDNGFINLFVPKEGGVPANKIAVGRTVANPAATMKKGTKFQRQRTGSSERYGINFHDMVANAYSGFLEVARKNDFDKALVDGGLAVIGKESPGPDWTSFPYEKTRVLGFNEGDLAFKKTTNNSIWLRKDLAQEYEIVSNLARNPFGKATSVMLGGWLNRFQMAGVLDAGFHSRALIKGLLEAPSSGLASEAGLSALARLDIVPKVARLVRTLFTDKIETRAKLADLANIGALSAKRPGINPINKAVKFVEENVRLTLGDIYDELAQEGRFPATETGKREFINRGLQYNMRLQSHTIRALRQTAIGPFVTAGRAGLARGVRRYALMDWAPPNDMPSRAWIAGNVLTKAAGTALLIGLANQLRTGTWTGRPGTPLGNIDVGNDDKGKIISITAADLLGNESRGGRAMGLRALIQSRRQGLSWNDTSAAMLRESINTLTHPILGPAVQAVYTGLTGQHLGVDLPESPAPLPGQSKIMARAKAAGEQLNPLVGAAEQVAGAKPERSPLETMAGAAGVVKTSPQQGNMPKIIHRSQLNTWVDSTLKQARQQGTASQQAAFLNTELRKLSYSDRQIALKEMKQHVPENVRARLR